MTAGNGGVDWDRDGFIYCAAKENDPIPNPRTPADFIANAGANDVYTVRFDGTALHRLTNTPTRGEADVSVSEDGTLVAFMDLLINPPNDRTEIWIANADGSRPRLVYTAGQPGIASVHVSGRRWDLEQHPRASNALRIRGASETRQRLALANGALEHQMRALTDAFDAPLLAQRFRQPTVARALVVEVVFSGVMPGGRSGADRLQSLRNCRTNTEPPCR